VRHLGRRERVFRSVNGQPVDRPSLALWMHFPGIDRDPAALVDMQLQLYKELRLDVLKVMSPGWYPVIDWGCRISSEAEPFVVPRFVEYAITESTDWRSLRALDTDKGEYGKQLAVVRMLREKTEAPIVATVFSPLTTASKLSGGAIVEHLRAHPKDVHMGLETIAKTTQDFLERVLAEGADGFFFATQCASRRLLTVSEYREFGCTYDYMVISPFEQRAELRVLHLHGTRIMFEELVNDYPVNMVNWYDRATWPSMREARSLTDKCLVGGIDHKGTLYSGTREQIRDEVLDAVVQSGDSNMVVSPGCVIPPDTDWDRLRIVSRTVHGLVGHDKNAEFPRQSRGPGDSDGTETRA